MVRCKKKEKLKEEEKFERGKEEDYIESRKGHQLSERRRAVNSEWNLIRRRSRNQQTRVKNKQEKVILCEVR